MQSRIRGFTLLELLVVIAIIGILATILILFVSSAQNKASVANGLQFEQNVLDTSGDRLVGEWLFDDCSGTVAKDTSGSGDNGTLVNGPAWSTDTPSGRGCSLGFNGSDYVGFSNATVANFSNQPFTVSAWIKPANLNQVADGDSFVSNAAYQVGGFFLSMSTICNTNGSGDICFEINAPGKAALIESQNNAVSPNNWSFITGTFDGTNMRLYIDGKLVASGTPGFTIGPTNQSLSIGAATQGGWGNYSGLVDNVRVYSSALTSSAVHNLYAEEAPKYGVAIR